MTATLNCLGWNKLCALVSCRPIKVLRLFVSVFFMTFYISSLGVFLVAINCNWFGGGPFYVADFPDACKY